MQVFVINMPGHAERRACAREKLDAAGIPFVFFDAISGQAAIEQEMFDAILEHEVLLNTGRHLTPGEIGCFASHRALWMRAIELDESIMIMEDDFDLHDRFSDAVKSAGDLIDDVGFLRLQRDRSARKIKVATNNGFTVSRYTKPPHCTLCYCVSPAAAGIFVENTRVLDAPVDVFVKKFWDHGQPLYALEPYTVVPSEFSAETTIHGRVKNRKPFMVSFHRFMRKVGWHWRRLLFNARARSVLAYEADIGATSAAKPSN